MTRAKPKASAASKSAGHRAKSLVIPGRRLRAGFDAARTTTESARHWQYADDLAPDAAANPEVRRILRRRARYEQFNNPYCDGQLATFAADIVGNGPQLQMATDIGNVNEYVEREFTVWAEAVGLGELLLIAVETRAAVGEVFFLLTSDPTLETTVKLRPRLIEPDQVATPQPWLSDPSRVDGIVFDRYGNPVEYHILRVHPGDTASAGYMPTDYQRVPAKFVLHYYRARRPGQRRGIPQITSSLRLYGERRDFRQSVLRAAEVAADLGAVLIESESPADTDVAVEPFDSVEIDRGMMSVLPSGFKGRQLEPVQPSTTYKEFDERMINEAARPLSMPYNVAACNSSSYNYASGRLDHQTYDRHARVEQGHLRRRVLDPILRAWLDEALMIPGYLPGRTRVAIARGLNHRWLWRDREDADPTKDAEARQIRLSSRQSTLREELARRGKDLETHVAELQREAELFDAAGLAVPVGMTPQQVQAAVQVLSVFAMGRITREAAVELLSAVGMPRARAEAAAAGSATGVPQVPASAPAESAPDVEAADLRRIRESLCGGNGNGQH